MTPSTLLNAFSPIESEQFRQFISGVSDYAIYMLSPEGIVSTWNAGAQRFKGYAPDEIIGQHFSRFYTEEDLATNLPARALRTALDTGKFEDEGWRVRKDGTRFWAHVVIDPIRNERGDLMGFAKVTRDVTDRKQAMDRLHASEERFRLLVQGVTDYAIYMLSPQGEITNWNSGATRIKGYSEEEAVGTHFSRFYTDEDRARGMPAKSLATAAREGRCESEGWRVRKDGTCFWAHVVIDSIRNERGELMGFAKVTRDITERRQAAEALERTKEALFQAQKLEAIGKLTGGVAHDFNNLLNVIVSGLDLLRRENPDLGGNATKILDSMQRAATRGSTLTQQLLTFARQQPLQQARHNLNRVIGSFESVLRQAINQSTGFEIRLDPTLPLVMIDAAQFETALLNLVVNARDATLDNGRIAVISQRVALREAEVNSLPAGEYVKITVQDTGSGMPADVATRAVEPFFTTKAVGKGTGMGLSQVYGLVQQSGGDLTIESAVGEGTSISIYLPSIGDEAAGDSPAGDDMHNETALVVDDQPDVLNISIELFRNLGYEVLSAANGKDALEVLEHNPHVDVLFSDVVMPEMNGIELAQRARSLRPKLNVILASGYAAPTLKAENVSIDEFQFISKPYRIAEIIKKLRVTK